MNSNRHVHVVGTGTIGEPLIGLLCDFRKELGIETVSFHKRSPLEDERAKVQNMIDRGALLCTDEPTIPKFEAQGFTVRWIAKEALDHASVVIDCTSDAGNTNKTTLYKDHEGTTLGFVAQGSEFGFGKMYARRINDGALDPDTDQYVQVVSCNTHNVAVLARTLALHGDDPGNLVEAKYVMMRRASDISQDRSFIPAPVVGKHDDPRFGTHHARDAWHLFDTLGYDLNLFSSAIKLNTQYMHALWFAIHLRERIGLKTLIERLTANPNIALTEKKSANQIFSFGRDHGHYGRILSQTVIPAATLTVRETADGGCEVVGFAFTPQDGNSLLSSAAITAWFLDPESYEERISCLRPFLFQTI